MINQWKTIPSLSQYQVNDRGEVRLAASGRKRRLRKSKGGYPCFHLVMLVHRLVCEAFHGPPPREGMVVNHKDGDKTNNHPDNLEWMTWQENAIHAHANGLMRPGSPRGAKNHFVKLTEAQVREIRARCAAGEQQRAVAREYGVSQGCISGVVTRRAWGWLD